MQLSGRKPVDEPEWMLYSDNQKEDPLVIEETKDKDLNVPLGPMSKSKKARFQQALHQLLYIIHDNLECADPITLVVIQAT